MKRLAGRMGEGLFALAISLAYVGPQPPPQAQELPADARQEQQRKENEKNFGLREETPEEKQAEVNEVTVEVAHVGKTSDQLLRIVATTGAVWDQTVGAPVQAPKLGAAVTIKRTMLGGMMCKLNKWTSYRCIRVDKPVSPAPNVAAVAQALPTQSAGSPQIEAPAAAAPSLPSTAAAGTGTAVRQVERRSPAVPPLAQVVPAPRSAGPSASPNVQSTSPSTTAMGLPQQTDKAANNVAPTLDVAKAESPKPITAPPPSKSDLQQLSPTVTPPNVAPKAENNLAKVEERRKQNEQNFGLHEATPEQKKVEVDEVSAEVAHAEQTSEQLLRIVTTTGAVWDQTVGAPVKPPKPGTVITIKRGALGGTICKIGKWTTYRCLRVDRPNQP